MIGNAVLDAGLAHVARTASRVDLCSAAPSTVGDVDGVSLGRCDAPQWRSPESNNRGRCLQSEPLEVTATGDGVARVWVVSSATDVLAVGEIQNPERLLPRMLVRLPSIEIEMKG